MQDGHMEHEPNGQRARVWIVDDERIIRRTVEDSLIEKGYACVSMAQVGQVLRALNQEVPEILITDLKLPDGDGLQILRAAKQRDPHCQVLIITGYGTVKTAVQAMHDGAFHYLPKPFDLDELCLLVERMAAHRQLRSELQRMRNVFVDRGGAGDLITRSPAMRRVQEMVAAVADTRAPVLITGESGTGKELLARAVHQLSARSDRALVSVNCAALPEALAEAELFGVEKGAFTGAVSQRDGRFLTAHRGTLFLDEIGDMPLPLQAKLLRVIEQGTLERLGSSTALEVDVRLVAATHRPLIELVKQGAFREDLYYRLNVMTVQIPPLRERSEDLVALLMHFIERYRHENGRQILGVAPDALRALTTYSWPGNVRELQNAVQRAVILCRRGDLQLHHFPPQVVEHMQPMEGETRAALGPDSTLQPLADAVDDFEKRYVLEALERCEHVKSETARALGISRKHLWSKLKKWQLSRVTRR